MLKLYVSNISVAQKQQKLVKEGDLYVPLLFLLNYKQSAASWHFCMPYLLF